MRRCFVEQEEQTRRQSRRGAALFREGGSEGGAVLDAGVRQNAAEVACSILVYRRKPIIF